MVLIILLLILVFKDLLQCQQSFKQKRMIMI